MLLNGAKVGKFNQPSNMVDFNRKINRLPRLQFLVIVILFYVLNLKAQAKETMIGDELVVDGGFEELERIPTKWYFNGVDFNNVMKYWNSPTMASPDVYTLSTKVPPGWLEKGNARTSAYKGTCMVGITTYGCGFGKPHCREYVQVKLKEALVIGQQYQIQMYTRPMNRTVWANNLGIFCSVIEINKSLDQRLKCKPQWKMTDIIKGTGTQWTLINGKFIAQTAGQFLNIGNFITDSLTKVEIPPGSNEQYAYYYIDEVSLRKVPPIIVKPSEEGTFDDCCLKQGDTVILKRIYFDFDKSSLESSSYVELNKLLRIMSNRGSMKVHLTGHTDKVGNIRYNTWLSRKRAEVVREFLLDNGIEDERIKVVAMSFSKPAASNKTDEGRKLNRRVEMYVVDY